MLHLCLVLHLQHSSEVTKTTGLRTQYVRPTIRTPVRIYHMALTMAPKRSIWRQHWHQNDQYGANVGARTINMAPTLAPYLRVRPLTDVGIWRPRWCHIFPPDLRPAQHAPHLEDDAISKISVARPKTKDKQHPHSSRISVAEK